MRVDLFVDGSREELAPLIVECVVICELIDSSWQKLALTRLAVMLG